MSIFVRTGFGFRIGVLAFGASLSLLLIVTEREQKVTDSAGSPLCRRGSREASRTDGACRPSGVTRRQYFLRASERWLGFVPDP